MFRDGNACDFDEGRNRNENSLYHQERQIPLDDLKRLGIPPPPEGRYMSRFQIPSPPRRKRSSSEAGDPDEHEKPSASSHRREKSSSPDHSYGGGRSTYNEDRHQKQRKQGIHSYRHEKKPSSSRERSHDRDERAYRHHRDMHRHDRWTPGDDFNYD
ncbi:UNVERIFIED_CONTAM: U11/U12 small nuclear ribonucleoprotein [Sesamum angustifolium]|uniref:U11/U12 small nuclear ribonucleoprotein n=1 Tax=Sesamum angustifolium TaxID=2727405 RepID=A0AAW2NZG3_9LAMI